MKRKYKRKAFYIDEDYIIEGYKDKYGFHPNKGIPCGFSLQKITSKMINKDIFYNYDLAKAELKNR